MRLVSLAGMATLFAAPAAAHAPGFQPFPALTVQDTASAAHISDDEFDAIVRQVETTSFDTPDSWQTELRLRRVALGKTEALIVRGSELLCGGTGNCQTWIFRRDDGGWTDLFDGEAPTVSSIGLARQTHHELPDVVATAHLSAAVTSYVVYVFDGKFYRTDRCYSAIEKQGMKLAPCRR